MGTNACRTAGIADTAEAKAKGGVWSGFWDADPEFWTPDPVRFPNGLQPLLERASARGMTRCCSPKSND